MEPYVIFNREGECITQIIVWVPNECDMNLVQQEIVNSGYIIEELITDNYFRAYKDKN